MVSAKRSAFFRGYFVILSLCLLLHDVKLIDDWLIYGTLTSRHLRPKPVSAAFWTALLRERRLSLPDTTRQLPELFRKAPCHGKVFARRPWVARAPRSPRSPVVRGYRPVTKLRRSNPRLTRAGLESTLRGRCIPLAMSWVLSPQASTATDDLLDRVMSGSGIAVPSLWPYEVSNSLVVLLRRKKMIREDYLAARMFFRRLRASIDDGGEYFAGDRTADLVIEHGLSVHAAAYLELAIRKQLALASRDAELNRAAKLCGVRVLLQRPQAR